MGDVEVHVVIKTPSIKTTDFHLSQTPTFLTVLELKEQLSVSFPSNPGVEQQRLIYGGKILQDGMTLGEVLAQVSFFSFLPFFFFFFFFFCLFVFVPSFFFFFFFFFF